ncbi:WD40-repeat-containing domain protein [Chytriomyces sp. MP71]|nr:WD40-repeat-containing domain protein [Chytriomyces sp. MP71]
MAGFGDGTVLILDRERDDHPTVAPVAIDSNFTVSKPLQKTASKVNPVSHWNLSKRPITSIQFSPDSVHVAITSLDGSLRVLDFAQDKLLDTCNSYFGGLLCCAWSPDGKFVATGGEDDLVTVWTFGGRIVARCQGHSSWVTGVAFDAYNCTERNYRIGSVSEDTKLCLWDFSSSSLYKPRSVRVAYPFACLCISPIQSMIFSHSFSFLSSTVHPVLPKKQVAMLEPFMAQSIHNEPLCFLAFREDAVVTADRVGAIKFWARPKVGEVDFEQQERGGGGMSHG